MSESRLSIQVDGSTAVTARRFAPTGAVEAMFLYAPGAGSNIDDAFGVYLCKELSRHGTEAWLFQFPYMEAKKRASDRTPLLEATWCAVAAQARLAEPQCLVAGGRSMGGRIASKVVAQGVGVDGLVLFAYPLVPPGRPAAVRTEHLPRIAAPTLFCSGTRDSFGTPEQLRDAAHLVPNATIYMLEGADHGFAVLKSSDRNRDEIFAEATAATLGFLKGLGLKAV
ncbi:MAG TPA: alpha/beta family hydrolase [Dehalococcoidia bacterium]|nr:alpha/beta family hydrolase [Dehalococcoidia bacterium]